MKLPYIEFYPSDWRGDVAVQTLSLHDRGVWFEMLCIMHQSEERGKLLVGGSPPSPELLARLVGTSRTDLESTLSRLLSSGVASKDPKTGVIYNRRMIRDEEKRKVRQRCGLLGGNPKLKVKLKVDLNPNGTGGREKNPLKEAVVDEVRKELSSMYGRSVGARWDYIEETALIDVCRRDGVLKELKQLKEFRDRDRFFPQSVETLLGGWQKHLDRSSKAHAPVIRKGPNI